MRELEAIQSEHRAILNLFLSVIILGLLLNCLVSAAFLWAGEWLGEVWGILVLVLVCATAIATYTTIRFAILAPVQATGEYPTLLVVDVEHNEIPVPLVLSARRERLLEGAPPPFPLLARKLYQLAISDSAAQVADAGAEDPTHGGLAEEIVQFAILEWYRRRHWVQWSVGKEYRHVGPFGAFGWSPDKPADKVPLSEVAARAGNQNRLIRLRYAASKEHFVLPRGVTMTVMSEGGGHSLAYASKVLDLSIRVRSGGGVGGAMNLYGWKRRFTAEPDDMFAHQLLVDYQVRVHEGIHRYVPPGLWQLGPLRRLKPDVGIEDLYHWARRFVEEVRDYLTWYESETEYVDSDAMEFVHEDGDGHLVYRFREPFMGADFIEF